MTQTLIMTGLIMKGLIMKGLIMKRPAAGGSHERGLKTTTGLRPQD
ncbi:MAG TPA: hypothetical protein VLL28_03580 [Hyphomicrobiaceae bacterium]|nr:hypothetical protein [Hyphomicrobiaceae bacterium]